MNRSLRRWEASVADAQARTAEQQGVFDANQELRRAGKVVGAQRASYAGQGIVVGSGTAGAVEEQAEAIGAADAAQIRSNAALAAWGYRANAGSLRMQGSIENAEGQQRAINSLLTSGSQGAADYYRMRDK